MDNHVYQIIDLKGRIEKLEQQVRYLLDELKINKQTGEWKINQAKKD